MKKWIAFILLIAICVSITVPIDAKAQTIAEFEEEVKKYTADLEERKSKIAKNDQEVAEIKKKIADIEAQITETENQIAHLQLEIEENTQEIAKKKEESKNIIAYYQVANGENAYLEYAFGATSITDMIYRMSVVEQLTEYNDNVMKELTELIKKNEQQKSELSAKKEELNVLSANLEEEKARIDADTASIKVGMPKIEEQIKAAKQQISSLKSMGCRNDETPEACVYRVNQNSGSNSLPSTNGFLRPIEYGYVSCEYGCYDGHMGIDMSSDNKSIEIYPIANGQVTARYYDPAGALVVKIRHNVGGSYIYSTYAHMRSWNVSINQYVTPYTMIGRMGSTGNSTGPHLHLEITTCDWKSVGGGCTWATYQDSTINPRRYVEFPSRWSNR